MTEPKTQTTNELTGRMMQFLLWMAQEGQVKLFPIEWSVMRKKARDRGFIQEAKLIYDNRGGPFMTYELSEKGKEAISS